MLRPGGLCLLVFAGLALVAAAANYTVAPVSSTPSPTALTKEETLKLLYEENEWKNGLALWVLPNSWTVAIPHFFRSWLRNYILANVVYLGTGTLWCVYLYGFARGRYYPEEAIPKAKDIFVQVKVSLAALPMFSMLPSCAEYIIEQGWTLCYAKTSQVGWPAYCAYLAIYMLLVEFGVYWAHRLLHDIKPLYRWLHAPHHIYNKQNTLSPFAGLAFNPIDGILQASPYVLSLFIVPMHALTYDMLLFATGVWTTNIHDNIHADIWPIMGAGYHTIHHITYRHNYGHYTTFMDQLFGTLHVPKTVKSS
eukprot:jgi/Chlat1/511/Chrsp103S01095